jgi:hypothetical protein
MRLWTLHPRYLDARGLTALWRESLLAQNVLAGNTVGYRNHPQLARFKALSDCVGAVAAYLAVVREEATRRGYRFDGSKIRPHGDPPRIPATTGQLDYEWAHLRAKLAQRSPDVLKRWAGVERPDVNPLFVLVPGAVESWERPMP